MQDEKELKWAGSTKSDIYDAYKRLLKEKNKLPSVQTTDSVSHKVKVTNAVKVASELNVQSTQELLKQTIAAKEQFDNINEAIKAKNQELQDVHGIIREANSLVVLAAAKDVIIKEKEEKAVNIIQEANDYRDETITDTKNTTDKLKADVAATITDVHKEEDRRNEIWEYNFGRKQQTEEDTLSDKLLIKSKSLNERERLLKIREDKIDDQDKHIDELTNQIHQLKTTMIEDVNKEVGKQKGILESRYKRDAEYVTKEHNADIKVLNGEISTYETTITRMEDQIDKLDNALESANDKASAIARAALQSEHANTTIETLQKGIKEASSNRK